MQQVWTLRSILQWTSEYFSKKGIDSHRLDAELLIAHAVGLDRIGLYRDFDRPVNESERALIRSYVQRRAQFEPVAHILNSRGFWQHDFYVDNRVLIPRPETEELIEYVLKWLKDHIDPRIADVGTGSGCIALTLADECKTAECIGFDVSEEALEVAQKNAQLLNIKSDFVKSDLLEKAEGLFDVIISNPPYIASDVIPTLMPDVQQYEPLLALDGGPDGLDCIRKLVPQAIDHLKPGGLLIFEIGYDQGQSASEICLNYKELKEVEIHKDYAKQDRFITAIRTDA